MAKGKKSGGKSSGKPKDFKSKHPHLFKKSPRDYRIGGDIQPRRNLSRFVKWPRYIRIQRQRAILKKRLKVPPALNHFSKTLDKNQASTLFRLLSKYRPETKEQKSDRRRQAAAAGAKDKDVKEGKKPKVLKFGINHVCTLVEQRKAKLVVIAHDVDPIELVVWLPALCRKKDVPYVIVKGKARLGHLVNHKTATAVALVDVNSEDVAKVNQIVSNTKTMYNESTTVLKEWGGGIMGVKAQAVQLRIQREKQKEESSKLKAQI